MASPFRIFRRYQKSLLIVAGVVLIFVFVLEDSLQMLMGGATGGGGDPSDNRPKPNAVAVHWNGGQLTNAELDQLVQRRRILNGFLREILREGDDAEVMLARATGAEPRPSPVLPLVRAETAQQRVEEDVVAVRLFADAARAAGMTVSDDVIRQYLHELGRGHVSPERMRTIIRQSQFGSSSTPSEYIFGALREELLAHYFERSHLFAIASVMPQQRWQDWRRVNDRVVVEAAALPADSFLIDVKDPTDEELSEYYEKYKNREPMPDIRFTPELPSPVPGFRIPRKVELQYVRADFEKLLAKLKGDISDDEVQQHYDKNKDPYYIKLDTALFDKEPDKKETETKPAGESGDKPETGDKQTESPPASAGGATSDKAGTPPTTDKSAAAHETRRNIFRLAAFQQPSPDSKGDAALPGGGTAPGTATQSGDTKAAIPATDATQPATTDAAQATDKPAETPKKPVEFLPLDDKLRDQIRDELAMPKVHERLNQLMMQLQGELGNEFNNYFRAVIDAKELKQPVPPPPPALADLSPLAEKHELEYRKTGPMSILELRDDAVIGKLSDMEAVTPLLRTLFGKDADLYKAILAVDDDMIRTNRFIVLKTGDTPGRVPPLEEIREQVLRAWRLDKASAAALARAEELAKKAEASGGPLGEFFGNDPTVKIVRTDPFAWLTGGEVALVDRQLQRRPYRLSEPDGIVAAGPEFMNKVFDLDDRQAAAVLNHDHSIAYVVRIVEHSNTEDKLREMYLGEADRWPGASTMIGQHAQAANQALVQSVLKAAGLERDRPLDPPDRGDAERPAD
ncbi:MAG: hypothetical protein WD669_01385 [Pirellulales bacterium]